MDISQYIDPKEYPDWRSTRIKGLLRDGVEPTPRDDKYIHRGYKFSRELEECDGSDTTIFNLAMKHQYVGKAVGLHNNKSNRRCYIEALALCADLDEQGIAEYMGEGPLMIRYYLKLFFDVRDKLENTGYICSRIMEPALLQAIQDCKDPGIAWKIAGLFGGYGAVRACWESRDAGTTVKNYFKSAGVTTMLKDFGVGTFLRPLNRFNIEMVADHVLRLAEMELKAQALTGAQGLSEDRVDMIKSVMDSMKFFVVDPTNKTLPAREPRLFERIDQSLVYTAIGAEAGE